MRKLIFLIPAFLMLSCSDSVTEEVLYNSASMDPIVKSMDKVVHFKDIQTLNRNDSLRTRSDEEIAMDIQCLTSKENNDTLLFVYQKPEGGWIIYSSDTRVPAIVAESEDGYFNDLMKIDGARLWIESMKEDMAAIREASDSELNFTTDEINNNQEFWYAISSPDDFVKTKINREMADTYAVLPEPVPIDPKGHYELNYTKTYTETFDSIPSMVEVQWHQWGNYNNGCPLQSNSNTKRAPVGCTALALGQIFYYFHYSIGVPIKAPSSADCEGDINNYQMSQGHPSSTIWDKMKNKSDSVAPLLANIGSLVGMIYGNEGSHPKKEENLINAVSEYGLSCKFDKYNNEILKEQLIQRKPVYVSANDSYKNTKSGHAFVIDSYRRSRKVTQNIYIWVWDQTPSTGSILPYHPDKIEYAYQTPVIDMVGINWGDGGSVNGGYHWQWYSLTGSWIWKTSQGDFNYNIQKNMIYDFKSK